MVTSVYWWSIWYFLYSLELSCFPTDKNRNIAYKRPFKKIFTHVIIVVITNLYRSDEFGDVDKNIGGQVVIIVVYIVNLNFISIYLSLVVMKTSSRPQTCIPRNGIFDVIQLLNNACQVIIVRRLNLNILHFKNIAI